MICIECHLKYSIISHTAWVCSTSSCRKSLEGIKGTFNESSPSLVRCENYRQWNIKAPPGTYLELTFDSFHVGQTFCFSNRFIGIRDGLESSSSILATLCDKPQNFPFPLRSSGNTMSVEMFGRWKGARFKARYQAIDFNTGGKTTTLCNNLYRMNLISRAGVAR